MLAEICVTSFNDAKMAWEAGAQRVELCTALPLGGVTPSFGLIKKVTAELPVQVHVLIRPREGNFTYTEEELQVMCNDIAHCNSMGCTGVVCGALNADHTVDEQAMRRLLHAAGNMDLTFHRAFDWVENRDTAAALLVKLGVKRVLSSGGCKTAPEGMRHLISLKEKFGKDLVVMPGGGVRPDNIMEFKAAGFQEVHFSASHMVMVDIPEPAVSMNATEMPDDRSLIQTDATTLHQMLSLVK